MSPKEFADMLLAFDNLLEARIKRIQSLLSKTEEEIVILDQKRLQLKALGDGIEQNLENTIEAVEKEILHHDIPDLRERVHNLSVPEME